MLRGKTLIKHKNHGRRARAHQVQARQGRGQAAGASGPVASVLTRPVQTEQDMAAHTQTMLAIVYNGGKIEGAC